MKNINNVNSMGVASNNATRAVTLDQYGDLLTVKDLSEFLGVSKQTVYKEMKAGKFGPQIKFGRGFRIPKIYIAQRYLAGYDIEEQM